jgi:lipopolysaccharide/colanic/teichoic acid biosynthesis glycosyltransferase
MWPRTPGEWRLGWIEHLAPEAFNGDETKPPDDARVSSAFARFCRRFSVDELPQLANVAGGQMSLVGPRPLTAAELRRHYSGVADEVTSVKPGITGVWQVGGRSRLSYAERRALDLQFVRERSPGLYLKVLARTVPVVLSGKDAW